MYVLVPELEELFIILFSVGNDEELAAKTGDETVKAEPLAVKVEQMEQAEEPQETTASPVKAEGAVKKVNVAPLPIKFELISPLAEFHSSMVKKSKERLELVANLGSYRRALCARRDLAIRRALCKVDKVIPVYLYTLHIFN